ncbi:hypothetical protein VTG60DRAFT_4103 [Thermothelomyces hinnuleus]
MQRTTRSCRRSYEKSCVHYFPGGVQGLKKVAGVFIFSLLQRHSFHFFFRQVLKRLWDIQRRISAKKHGTSGFNGKFLARRGPLEGAILSFILLICFATLERPLEGWEHHQISVSFLFSWTRRAPAIPASRHVFALFLISWVSQDGYTPFEFCFSYHRLVGSN